MAFAFFPRKKNKPAIQNHPGIPAIRCSICTGEQVAGFRNPETGKFEEYAAVHSDADLEAFLSEYGLKKDELRTIY